MKFFGLFLLILLTISSNAQVFDIVIDKSGEGDFTRVQDAINSIPNYQVERTLIFIKSGFYNEKVVVSDSKTNISIIGENAENVVISWNDYQGKNGMGGAESSTFWADSPGLYAENITFQNTAGKVGQALALRTTGDTMVFKNCRMLGFQDTYYAHKRRQYNLNCYIEGATDFVYGDATAVFDSCTINCVKGGQYISAPADTKLITNLVGEKFLHGLLFRYCDVTSDNDVSANSYYLGRPWQPNASSVYIHCVLGSHIKSGGWSIWGGTNNHESSVFAEYKNTNPDGSFIDISNRVSWSYQLEDDRVKNLYKLDFFLRKNGKIWDAKRITRALPVPKKFVVNGNELTWSPVENAIGYVVLHNDSVIGFSETATYIDSNFSSENNEYAVRSVSISGALSKSTSDIFTAINSIEKNKDEIQIILMDEEIQFSEIVDYRIYTIQGKLVQKGESKSASINGFKNGIYLINAFNKNGIQLSKKVIL